MRILVCGEGPHDIGEQSAWCTKTETHVQTDGWLQPILQNCLERELKFERKKLREIVLLPGNKHRPWPPGHGAKAKMARIISEGFDLIVFMTDADTADVASWESKRAEILAGFSQASTGAYGVACVPKASSESWLLSDPSAWERLFGKQHDDWPSNLENIWGNRHDPQSYHPKMVFARVCKAIGAPDSRETRSLLAQTIGIHELREKCPISFAAFEEDLREASR